MIPDPYRSQNLNLPYIAPSQAMKHITVNEALRAIDALVQLGVVSTETTAPPQNPAEGSRYIIPISATGDWAGREGQVAAWQDSAWAYFTPQAGWRVWDMATKRLLVRVDGEWQSVTGFENLPGLGIGTTSDANNKFAVKSPGTLLSHDGSDHFLKINKAAGGDTASVIYQTAFSGRAEIGLTGDDDFHIKVSPDGTTWHEAMILDRTTGICRPQKIAFAAHLTATQSGIPTGTTTKLDFDRAPVNQGGFYDTANSRFQPPAGVYRLHASLHTVGAEDGLRMSAVIRKNGSDVAFNYVASSGTSNQNVSVDGLVVANGADFFEIGLKPLGAGTRSVIGSAVFTYFHGHAI